MKTFETKDELDQEIQRIEALGFKIHHSALTSGYVSRRIAGTVEEYKGQYGHGFIIHEPSYAGTKYHTITYYVQ